MKKDTAKAANREWILKKKFLANFCKEGFIKLCEKLPKLLPTGKVTV